MRYRLYDIDRIISRTVSYALVSAVVVAVYAGGVLALSNALGAGSEISVAASTLVAVAAFSPARRRIQAAVDRRFNRARYDAEAVVTRYRQTLRDEVDLERVGEELAQAARHAVHPAAISVWLRPAPAGDGPRNDYVPMAPQSRARDRAR